MIVAIPWPCQASATRNATSARVGVDPHVGGVGDDPPSASPVSATSAIAIGVVDVHGPVGRPVEVGGAEEAKGDRLR